MNRPVRSLRRYLLSGVLLLVSSSLGISALLGYFSASHEMEELFDARLAQYSRITETLLLRYLDQQIAIPEQGAIYQEWEQLHPEARAKNSTLDEDGEMTPYGHAFERNLSFQLIDSRGQLLLRSPSAPATPFGERQPGFGEVTLAHHSWRTFTLHNPARGTWLVVAERDDERGELSASIATIATLPLLITLPLLLLLLWWLVNRSLSPLTRLAAAIAERHPANLTPLQIPQPPKEVGLLIAELNRLMHTLDETLDRERQFTNEAAHELRTPLAVLRLHSENALAADSEQGRQRALHKMLAALDRSDRLLRQLLTHTRLDNQQQIQRQPLDLRETVRETLANLVPLALKKQQQIALEGEQPLFIDGQATLLDLMVANLVDNAIRYTPVGGAITLSLEQEGTLTALHVRDTGPGVPPALISRLTERFFRVNPHEGNGVGLGMAIVARIVGLHGASMRLTNRPQGGLEVSVYFPLTTDKPNK